MTHRYCTAFFAPQGGESQGNVGAPLVHRCFCHGSQILVMPAFCTLSIATPHDNQCSTDAEGMSESGVLGGTAQQPSFLGVRGETRPEFRENDVNLALFRLPGSCVELYAGFEARDISSTCPLQACMSVVSTARL